MSDYYSVIGKNPEWNADWTVHNYTLLAAAMKGAGITDPAIAAVFGNISVEAASFNPGQIEKKEVGNVIRGGVGFIQWTNPNGVNKIYQYFGADGWYIGENQASILIAELVGNEEGWITTAEYPYSQYQFSAWQDSSEQSLRYLAKMYRANRERGTGGETAGDWAVYYYKVITGIEPGPPPGPGPHPPDPPTPVDNRPFLKKKVIYRKRRHY